ncbi:IS66 family insertion sequence element accessory protein TnpB, partial [Reyranella sp.]|uniref:IS66 family insertion sequence element accessory protein TnpB n=2 Tax=Reyranella sp. TaxID=1929291 RepID=UPI004036C60C
AEGDVMIIPPGPLRVLVATKPVDFRKGMDGLAALVKEQLGTDPFSGEIYVFRAKRADRVKLLMWDGSGLVLVSKRLGEGQFRWPRVEDGVMRLPPPPRPVDGAAGRTGLDARARAPGAHAACRAVAGAT